MTTSRFNQVRYTLYAPVYDLAVAHLPLFRRGRQRSIALAELRAGERALLVAAGTGLDLEFLPHGLDVIATDITPAMLARLAARLRESSRAEAPRVASAVMDATCLALPDASVDCVVLHLALAVVPDPVATLREAARVLRPNGRVAVFDKFLPDGARPSLARRVVGAVARVIATDLNRQLGPLLASAGLRETARESVGLGGAFVVAVARAEPAPARSAMGPASGG